ncbi:MAG: hypothetical protein ACRCWS_03430 [Propionibacteriaceae bacterium]
MIIISNGWEENVEILCVDVPMLKTRVGSLGIRERAWLKQHLHENSPAISGDISAP